jgi:hypothetical protein
MGVGGATHSRVGSPRVMTGTGGASAPAPQWPSAMPGQGEAETGADRRHEHVGAPWEAAR